MASQYHETYQSWMRGPEEFWANAAGDIDWFSRWDKVFDSEAGIYGRWFTGALCNTCHNCVDRHVPAGRADQPALIYDSPITASKRSITYGELLDDVAVLAAVLSDRGISKGDRVIIYMPMVPEAVIAMLACARIGVIHSVVFGGFAANELATRIEDAGARAVLTASCGLEPGRIVSYKPLLDAAIARSKVKPEFCLILQREAERAPLEPGRDIDWADAVAAARAAGRSADCVPVLATDPLYILYTSGTTGRPKGVVRDNGGHMVALKWSMPNIYAISPGEAFWAASDVGWVVGHSYIAYAPLLHGATSILYEGKPVGTPDAGAFWRVASEHGVASLFTAPTAFRAIRKEDPEGKLIRDYDLSRFRALFLAGERGDPPTVKWAEEKLGVPVIDHWWQTETGWSITANPLGLGLLDVRHGSPGVAMPGYDIRVLDEAGAEAAPGTIGAIAVKLPLPPSSLPTLWNDDERFRASYLTTFPGHYETSDAGYVDEEGYVYVMARTDDIINVAGHRLSTGAMEEVLASHADVAECAVVGVADQLKGQVPVGFLVLNSGVNRDPSEIEQESVAMVRQEIGPVASFKLALTVARLPKTRSGKILRATMRKIADGEDYAMPATIDDPEILNEIAGALKARGLAS